MDAQRHYQSLIRHLATPTSATGGGADSDAVIASVEQELQLLDAALADASRQVAVHDNNNSGRRGKDGRGRGSTVSTTKPYVLRNAMVHSLFVAQQARWRAQRFPTLVAGGAKWNPPETFQRRTEKYWVLPHRILAVKQFVARYLPVLEVNPSLPPSNDWATFSDTQVNNYLSSIYFDSPRDLSCYHRRLELTEGAWLLRLRWYGGRMPHDTRGGGDATMAVRGPLPLPPDPASECICYFELKTHHDKEATGKQSTKERFPIALSDVDAFIGGSIAPQELIAALVTRGKIKAAKAEEQMKLARRVQRLFIEKGIRPVLRTVYHRTAFQRDDSNEVRCSLDMPLYIHLEKPTDTRSIVSLVYEPVYVGPTPLPFGVLEIKLSLTNAPQPGAVAATAARGGSADDAARPMINTHTAASSLGEPPAWVEMLHRTGWIKRVEKFSKFQYGICVDQCWEGLRREKPYWFPLVKSTRNFVRRLWWSKVVDRTWATYAKAVMGALPPREQTSSSSSESSSSSSSDDSEDDESSSSSEEESSSDDE